MDIIDSIELGTVDGFDIRADLVPDEQYYSEPDGDYSPDAVAAFRNGDWHYVGIIVTASRAGIDLGSDSIWAVEYGTMPVGKWGYPPNVPAGGESRMIDPLRDEGGSLDYYRADMIDAAVTAARATLASLMSGEVG